MKHLFLIPWFFFVLVVASKAQQRTSDSLGALLQKHRYPDTVRLHLLNDFVFHRLLNFGKEERLLAEEALGIAEKVNDPYGKVKAMGNMAIILAREGKGTKAVSMAEQSLRLAKQTTSKSSLAYALWYIGRVYAYNNDNAKALPYFKQAVKYAHEAGNFFLKSLLLGWLGLISSSSGHYPQALDYYLQGLAAAERSGSLSQVAYAQLSLASFYSLHADFTQALAFQLKAIPIAEQAGNFHVLSNAWRGVGDTYRLQGNFSEAIKAYQQCLQVNRTKKGGPWSEDDALIGLADVYDKQKQYSLAKAFAFASLRIALSRPRKVPADESECRRVLASIYLHTGRLDSARWQADSSLSLAASITDKNKIRDAYEVLYQTCARQGDFTRAFQYQSAFMAYKDSLSKDESNRRLALLQYSQELNKKEANIALLKKDQQIKIQETRRQRQFFLLTLAGLGIVALLAAALWRNNRQKQKANTLLQQQKLETEKAYDQLKATQQQLIQQEKMASLGELTAGIAHEIQNPLNFVNNFSLVNKELVTELKQEAIAGNINEVLSLAGSIEENEEKISHHGKRADAIVKSMLQHSRGSTGEKQPTNINKLVDEYLRLSFHGFRGKDKAFSATVETHFDPAVGMANVVPQEVGRVLLNLLNNAFYAVRQKKQQSNGQYEPVVSVATEKKNNHVVITVSDNGTGISKKAIDKVFQPFFTTKPTGEGTGLGLSLSYDVVTNGHGGKLAVKSREGEGSEFVIELPAEAK